MKVIKASSELMRFTPDLEEVIEHAGRTCYRSHDKVCDGGAGDFISRIKNFKHYSVLEHGAITVRFVVDRGVMAELTRHRLASFSVESSRYCNYSKGKFGNQITVVSPAWATSDTDPDYQEWFLACSRAESAYFNLLSHGWKPEQARSVLPMSLATELVMTANPREWLHVFDCRCHRDAHPSMREVMVPLQTVFLDYWPAIFR